MKITLEVPDWASNRDIWLFAGREPFARKLRGKPLEVKTVRCNKCGKCCMDKDKARLKWFFGTKPDGSCLMLKFERVHHSDGRKEEGYFCKLRGSIVPYLCCRGDGVPEECAIEYEPVE